MELWLDAHISPALATWFNEEFAIAVYSLKFLGLRDAFDADIFKKAKAKGEVVILTKDYDFVLLQNALGAPPKIILLTIGNCSNDKLKTVIQSKFSKALQLLNDNNVVEIAE
ncbi:MAG: DUF5615 family PIN-like protein [Flavobacteriales bacterium]